MRAYVRNWVDKNITPNCHDWDEAKMLPRSVFVDFAKSGLLNMVVMHTMKEGDNVYPFPIGLTLSTLDVFHELIAVDEVRIHTVYSCFSTRMPILCDVLVVTHYCSR